MTLYTRDTWQDRYMAIEKRVMEYEQRIHNRIIATARKAGVYEYGMIHNAWLCRNTSPWQGVNYELLHQVAELDKKRYFARRAFNQWSQRSWRELMQQGEQKS